MSEINLKCFKIVLKVPLFAWNKANKFILEEIHAYIHIAVIFGSLDELISWKVALCKNTEFTTDWPSVILS